jgi:hypothetical protein
VTTEKINHPLHYGGDTIYEHIKVVEAWGLGYNLGNATKYISRAGKKDPAKHLEDLEKARWYLDREIANVRSAQMPQGRSKPLPATGIGPYGENAVAERPKAQDPAIDPGLKQPSKAEWVRDSDETLGVNLGGVYQCFARGSDFVKVRNSRSEMVWLPIESVRLTFNEE